MTTGAPLSGNTNTGSVNLPYPDYMYSNLYNTGNIDNLQYADLALAMKKNQSGSVNPVIQDALSKLTGSIAQGELRNAMPNEQGFANMGSGTAVAGVPAPMNPADTVQQRYAPQVAPMNSADVVQQRYNLPNNQTTGSQASTSTLTSGGDLQAALMQQIANQSQSTTNVSTDTGVTTDTSVPVVTGGGGGGQMATGVQGFVAPTDQTANINTAFDNLEGTVRDEFGNLQTVDFTAQIQDLIEQGRLSLQDLNSQQIVALQEAAMRREGQIGEIQTGLEGDLAQQEQYRQTIQEQVANQAAQRAGEMTADQAARVKAGREALGPQVTSEFEEVAALTGGLTGSQAMSTTAGMDRLAQVANQAAAQRLAAPAQLAAEAKMAVGDERFRLENQLQQQLSAGLAELNMQEQQQVLQEAMRQEQFGIERDQAMANALMSIASQRTGATLGEAQRLEDVALRQGEILQGQAFQAGEAQKNRDFQAAQAAASRAAARASEDRRTAAQQEQLDKAISGLVLSAEQLYGESLTSEQAEALVSSGMVDVWMQQNQTADERAWIIEQAGIAHQNEMDALEYEAELERQGADTSPSAMFDLSFPNADSSLRGHALQHWQLSEEDKTEWLDKTYPIGDAVASDSVRQKNGENRADLQNMWAIRTQIHENIKAEQLAEDKRVSGNPNPYTAPLGAVDPYTYTRYGVTPKPTVSPKQFDQ